MGAGNDVTAGPGGAGRLVLDSYGRLSQVPETGEWEKVATQHADNRRLIARLGAVLGVELDDGVSAWQRGVRRAGWERLLERVEQGCSDGIVVWHTDRLFRQPRDLERLIDLADKGYRIYSARGARDLSDPDDRFILRVEVAHAARSSDDAQRRIQRRFAALRERGVPHAGGRSFGFPGNDRAWAGAADERPEVPEEQVERERQALREATRDVLAGVSQAAIAQQWNQEGLVTASGKAWTPVGVRQVLLRPRNAGLIVHDGEVVGRMPGQPVVDEGEFKRLQAKFAGRRRGRRPGRTYPGSGVLRCGRCGRPLSGRVQSSTYPDGSKRRQYHCRKPSGGCGGVAADARAVDAQLRLFVAARLSDPRHAAAIQAARSQVAERLTTVNAEIAECERLQQALSDRLGRRELSLAAFDTANTPLAESLAKLTGERDALLAEGGAPDGPSVALPQETIFEQWDDGDAERQRGMLQRALGPAQLLLDPATRGRASFDPNRLRLATPNHPAEQPPETAPTGSVDE